MTVSTFHVWLVFAHQDGGDELLGAFSTLEKAAERVRSEARRRNSAIAEDEDGRPCVPGPDGIHIKTLEVS